MTRVELAREYRGKIKSLAPYVPDKLAGGLMDLFYPWRPDIDYKKDDRARDGEFLYKCLQDHSSQASWSPSASPSLWVRIDNPSEEWPAWRQPTGATDAYQVGSKVSHSGNHYVSISPNNVWEPGVYGWQLA